MRFRPAFVGILLLVVLSGAVVAAGTATSSGTESVMWAQSTETFESADPSLVVAVQLQADGDARWHITYRYLVDGANETRAFERFAGQVKRGERDVGVDRETFVRFANAASETTGRNMRIRDANWTGSTVENGTGTVTYSFTWTNFGRVNGGSLFVGDAFRSPDGTWFPRLYDGQRLVIRPPSGLNIVGTPPDKGLDQRALVWDGYREFEPGYLSVVLERPTTTTTTTATTSTVQTSTQGPVTPDDSFLLGVGFALLLVFVGAGSYFFARWQTQQDDGDGQGSVPEASNGGSPPTAGAASDAGPATEAGSDAASATAAESESSSDASTSAPGADRAVSGATAAGTTEGAAEADDEGDGEDDGVDEALLSDEERVLRLLEGNGGRMKQANIVTETGWSNAKVSQLLSGMHDDDEIQKLRIGRENLIALPEENVADFGNNE